VIAWNKAFPSQVAVGLERVRNGAGTLIWDLNHGSRAAHAASAGGAGAGGAGAGGQLGAPFAAGGGGPLSVSLSLSAAGLASAAAQQSLQGGILPRSPSTEG
jgi:hypothetical protein